MTHKAQQLHLFNDERGTFIEQKCAFHTYGSPYYLVQKVRSFAEYIVINKRTGATTYTAHFPFEGGSVSLSTTYMGVSYELSIDVKANNEEAMKDKPSTLKVSTYHLDTVESLNHENAMDFYSYFNLAVYSGIGAVVDYLLKKFANRSQIDFYEVLGLIPTYDEIEEADEDYKGEPFSNDELERLKEEVITSGFLY